MTQQEVYKRINNMNHIQFQTVSSPNQVYTAHNSSKLTTCLEICSDRATINLAAGDYVGEFVLLKNSITLQGDANFLSFILNCMCGLTIKAKYARGVFSLAKK